MTTRERHTSTRALRLGFWAMNGGLALMVGLSLLPIGLIQASASIGHGLWYARSAELLQQPLLQNLRWLRFVGDVVFMVGVAAFSWFVLGLFRGWSYQRSGEQAALEPAGDAASSQAM